MTSKAPTLTVKALKAALEEIPDDAIVKLLGYEVDPKGHAVDGTDNTYRLVHVEAFQNDDEDKRQVWAALWGILEYPEKED